MLSPVRVRRDWDEGYFECVVEIDLDSVSTLPFSLLSLFLFRLLFTLRIPPPPPPPLHPAPLPPLPLIHSVLPPPNPFLAPPNPSPLIFHNSTHSPLSCLPYLSPVVQRDHPLPQCHCIVSDYNIILIHSSIDREDHLPWATPSH